MQEAPLCESVEQELVRLSHSTGFCPAHHFPNYEAQTESTPWALTLVAQDRELHAAVVLAVGSSLRAAPLVIGTLHLS